MPRQAMALPLSVVNTCDDTSSWQALPLLTRAMVKLQDSAWTEFHARYFDRLLAYAVVVHRGDCATAEDTVQAAFLRAVRHMRVFEKEDVFWSWLTLLVRCAATDAGRKLTSRTRLHEALVAENQDWLGRRTNRRREETRFVLLDEALTLLCDEDRNLLTAKYAEGASTRELAQSLATTAKAIENRLRRLRHQLKAQLNDLAKRTQY